MLGAELVRAVLDDYRAAPIDEKLRATLAFLEKLTLAPDELSRADVEPMRRAGVSPAAMRDASYVAAAFNVIDRVADSLGFRVPDAAAFRRSARFLLTIGYR